MKLNEMFVGNYFKAADLENPVLLSINRVSMEELGDIKEQKWVVWFEEDARGCVLNQTRGAEIEAATGSDDTDDWLGHKIVLYRGQTRMSGKVVDCVAVRAPKGAAPPQDDDIPF